MIIASLAARSKCGYVLANSTSGGVFFEFAKAVISEGGVVFGAAWKDDYSGVRHTWVESLDGVMGLCGSKYVTSDIRASLRQLMEFMATGRTILFTGTPCQVAAVRHISKGHPNVILCALFCYGNVEPDVWRQYKLELEDEAGECVVGVKFRDKEIGGWLNGRFVVNFSDSIVDKSEDPSENAYMRAFYCGLSLRQSCLACPFRGGKCGADIMIGDFWGVETVCPEFMDNRGVNAVLVYTSSGKKIFEKANLDSRSVTYEQILAGNPCLETFKYAVNLRARERFLQNYKAIGVARAVDYAFNRSIWMRILDKVRRFLP